MTFDRRAKLGELKARRRRLTVKAATYKRPPGQMLAELQRVNGTIHRLAAELTPATGLRLNADYWDSWSEYMTQQGIMPSGRGNGYGGRR